MKKENVPRKRSSGKLSSVRKHDIKKLTMRGAFAVVAISLVWTLVSQQFVISTKSKEIDALESKIQEAELQSEKLRQEVDNLQNPEYIERIAREQLGLVRPNERVFVDSNKSEENNSK